MQTMLQRMATTVRLSAATRQDRCKRVLGPTAAFIQ
jgi:hypothetical protein